SKRCPKGNTLEERFGQESTTIDLPVLTAARLSATFPYVTPMARAVGPNQSEDGLPSIHMADGGYYDNFGVMAALEWLLKLCPKDEARACLLDRFERIALIEINPFAPPGQLLEYPPEAECESADGSWKRAFTGPIETILNVRTSSQRSRNGLELELLRRALLQRIQDEGEGKSGPEIRRFLFQPPRRAFGKRPGSDADPSCASLPDRDPPVSWYLSNTDVRGIDCDWSNSRTQEEVERFVGFFNEGGEPSP
ncbi:MAG: hypothetical protein KDD47_26620, partial [Acidobacteria bacterium]|nr:hypothetical protein [Acidobacteriota bacterium]